MVPAHVGQLLGSRNWLTSRRLTRLYMITTRYATSGILWPGMFWWAWRDSNSHVRRRQFLRLVCMQFHHRPLALRGRFERPIVGLEATRVTIRIRSTLVGRAGFEPARFPKGLLGLQPRGFSHSPISPMSKNL